MKTWFISDLHIDHNNIIKYSNRPFKGIQEMQESFIYNWNSVVAEGDDIYHLGDFTLSGTTKLQNIVDFIYKLKGNKVFLQGNHDNPNLFKEVKKTLESYKAFKETNNGNLNFEFVNSPYREITVSKQRVVLCHFPLAEWLGVDKGTFHLHGHCHGNLQFKDGKILDVGWDSLYAKFGMMRPIGMEEVVEYMSKRKDRLFRHKRDIE